MALKAIGLEKCADVKEGGQLLAARPLGSAFIF